MAAARASAVAAAAPRRRRRRDDVGEKGTNEAEEGVDEGGEVDAMCATVAPNP
jgi:hypothetical protein